jgi:hypothetical protein
MIERTLRYGSAPIYDFEKDAMLALLRELPGANVVRVDTHAFYDDATRTDIECAVDDAFVTTHTVTNCGLPYLELVVRADSKKSLAVIEQCIDAAMARRGFPRVADSTPPPVAPQTPAKTPPIVPEPDAPLLPGERAIIDLIVAGRSHEDSDQDGGFRTFSFRDGRFVQTYGSHMYPNSDGEIVYAGPKAFLRDLLETCAYERARAPTTEAFLDAVRRSIARG